MAERRRSGGSPRRSRRGGGGRAPQAYNGAVREQLGNLQRARIIGAMFDVAAQRGASGVTVAHIVERSGVSRRTFYENFTDREDCLLAAFERALALASESVIPAYDVGRGWRERIRAGLLAFLAFCDEQPRVARLLVFESQASGDRVARRRSDVLTALTRIVDQGRNEGKAASLSPLVAEGTVGGVLTVIHARLTAPERAGTSSSSSTRGAWRAEHASERGRRDAPSMLALTNELMSMIVLPYLGGAAARKELDRPEPKPTVSAPRLDAPLSSDPFKDAGMRLTYRTVRVLMAIAQHPDGSNRTIGQTAGITDQGQISKLLSRLERIGLAENTHPHPGKGAPNSWALTEKGRRIAQSIRLNTEGSQRGERDSRDAT